MIDNDFLIQFEKQVSLFQNKKKLFYLDSSNTIFASISYQQLHHQALLFAEHLTTLNCAGERVVLCFSAGFEFLVALLGCFYAKAIAVPLNVASNKYDSRFDSVRQDCDPLLMVSTHDLMTCILRDVLDHDIASPAYVTLETVSYVHLKKWTAKKETSFLSRMNDDIAFIQYTSGSTSAPKGVQVTFKSLIFALHYMQHSFRSTDVDVGLCWVPHYHDMGLVSGLLSPIFFGIDNYIMSPDTFIRNPIIWLSAITKHNITITGGPNFAYALCLEEAMRGETISHLQLNSWRAATNGAEPIQKETMDNFFREFQSVGFSKSAFYPCYGLAEAVLMVSCKWDPLPIVRNVCPLALKQDSIELVSQKPFVSLVSSGRAFLSMRIAIVDPNTHLEVPPYHLGEIWVYGPGVAAGYWKQPKLNETIFNAVIVDTQEGPFFKDRG